MHRKPTIGLLTPFLGGNYLGDMINAIQKMSLRCGVRLVAIRTAGKPYNCPIAMEHVDGWIILNNAVTDDFLNELSERWHKPIVTIAKDLKTLQVKGQTIYYDNEVGIIKAVRHLYEHGHRAIGFVWHPEQDEIMQRYSGYRKALEQLGLPYNPDYVIDSGDLSALGGRKAAQQIADASFPFKAAVACTDLIAIGMIDRFQELGCHTPEDFAIIGFDNSYSAQANKPSISSVTHNMDKAGAAAVELLLSQINGQEPSLNDQIIECELTLRASCGCSDYRKAAVPAERRMEEQSTNQDRMTQLDNHYEFNKFILNQEVETMKDLSWALAPHFDWASMGLWNELAPESDNLTIKEWYHFRSSAERISFDDQESHISLAISDFPAIEQLCSEQEIQACDMTYIIPYRTVQDNWSVLAFGTSLDHTTSHMDDYLSVVHYLDMIASTLDRQALVKEVREQGLQYRQIAEQLEIVSRTSNDGIWDLNLVTGEVIWNQRFFELLGRHAAERLEGLLHAEDLPKYQTAIRMHLEEQAPFQMEARLRKQSGQYVWVSISGGAVYDHEGKPVRMVCSVRDITEQRQADDKMRYLAYHDTLTGLTNRRRFYEEVAAAAIHYDQPFAVIVLDLDFFKKINDSYGHQMGDRLLQLVADKLRELIGRNDHISRFGGDEFVILYQFQAIEEVESFARSISEHLMTILFDERVNLTITMSAGISLFPRDGADPDTLIKKADIAMYKVKQNGKNQYEIFSSQMIEQTMWRINMENELSEALEKKQFVLHYQPQIHLETGELFGAEALLRWNSPTQGLVMPLSFIPIAEETGLINPIGEWVITEACRQSAEWLSKGYDPIKISVNISGKQLQKPGFIDKMKKIIESTGMNPQHLCIEITESTVIDDLESTIMMINQLTELGISMSMDDFGTGYSSLSMLRKLPLNMLKIDKSFIQDMTNEHQDFDIVKAIISISNSLKLSIVAEGVEDKDQYELLRELGCHYIQGFYISDPLPAVKFEKEMLGKKVRSNKKRKA